MKLFLCLIFCITLYKLFGIFIVRSLPSVVTTNKYYVPHLRLDGNLDSSFCQSKGYRCEKDEQCDCTSICKTHTMLKRYIDSEEVYMNGEKLEPGLYCLPVGYSDCNVNTTNPVYNLGGGWSCIPKYGNTQKYCKSVYAQNNDKNVLWDMLRNELADVIQDVDEKMINQEYRFQCKCESLDHVGNVMINLPLFPFDCFSDYCLRNLFHTSAIGYDFKKNECNCNTASDGSLYHENENDLRSPCNVFPNAYSTDEKTLNSYAHCKSSKSIHLLTTDIKLVCSAHYATGAAHATPFKKRLMLGSDNEQQLLE